MHGPATGIFAQPAGLRRLPAVGAGPPSTVGPSAHYTDFEWSRIWRGPPADSGREISGIDMPPVRDRGRCPPVAAVGVTMWLKPIPRHTFRHQARRRQAAPPLLADQSLNHLRGCGLRGVHPGGEQQRQQRRVARDRRPGQDGSAAGGLPPVATSGYGNRAWIPRWAESPRCRFRRSRIVEEDMVRAHDQGPAQIVLVPEFRVHTGPATPWLRRWRPSTADQPRSRTTCRAASRGEFSQAGAPRPRVSRTKVDGCHGQSPNRRNLSDVEHSFFFLFCLK